MSALGLVVNYTANSRATTKKGRKKYKQYAKKGGKWNHINSSIKTTEGRKKWKTKIRTTCRNKYHKYTNTINNNPAISVTSLSVDGLNAMTKIQKLSE